MKRFFLLILSLTVMQLNLLAQKKITVYVLRHAEKDMLHPSEKNPGLSELGKKRAENLINLINTKNLKAIYSTPYKRTTETVEPLSSLINLPISNYTPNAHQQMVDVIKKSNHGAYVIVGHSNTILPLLKDLGGNCNINTINDEDYGQLFILKLHKEKAKCSVKSY